MLSQVRTQYHRKPSEYEECDHCDNEIVPDHEREFFAIHVRFVGHLDIANHKVGDDQAKYFEDVPR